MFPRMIGLSWTLMFEMFFYAVMAAILLVTIRRAVPAIMTFFCLTPMIGMIVGLRLSHWIVLCNPILLEFVFGMIIALAYRRFGSRRSFGLPLVGVTLSLYLRAYPPLRVGLAGHS